MALAPVKTGALSSAIDTVKWLVLRWEKGSVSPIKSNRDRRRLSVATREKNGASKGPKTDPNVPRGSAANCARINRRGGSSGGNTEGKKEKKKNNTPSND